MVGFCRRPYMCIFQQCSICAFWLCMTGICLSLSPDPDLKLPGFCGFWDWRYHPALSWAVVAVEDMGWGRSWPL